MREWAHTFFFQSIDPLQCLNKRSKVKVRDCDSQDGTNPEDQLNEIGSCGQMW